MFKSKFLLPPARHSLVWLASRPSRPNRPGQPQNSLAAEHWNRGLPFILCRQREGEELSLGFCLPSENNNKPSRHALAARWSEVGMLARPPLLREVAMAIPELQPLLALAPKNNPRVIGSAMWEYLTKESFLRSWSDIDLIWGLRENENPAVAIEFFQKAGTLPETRIDGEIHFPGHGEVAWREWISSSPSVLVKSPTEASLVSRELLIEQHGASSLPHHPLANAAVDSLLEELELYPKPGLVSSQDSGSHTDMDYSLMRKSAESLLPFFAEIETNPGDFRECLQPIGIRAERHMLEVTGGVNTHRGAIFLLGLLIAAAARTTDRSPAGIRQSLLAHYGPALREHENAIARSVSHGAKARQLHGCSGIRGEAALGFPSIFEIALPHFDQLRDQGNCRQAAALETFLLLVSRTDDSNLLHRGGLSGANLARESAAKFLSDGGVRQAAWFQKFQSLHNQFTQLCLSPGGCADLLAVTLFLDRIR